MMDSSKTHMNTSKNKSTNTNNADKVNDVTKEDNTKNNNINLEVCNCCKNDMNLLKNHFLCKKITALEEEIEILKKYVGGLVRIIQHDEITTTANKKLSKCINDLNISQNSNSIIDNKKIPIDTKKDDLTEKMLVKYCTLIPQEVKNLQKFMNGHILMNKYRIDKNNEKDIIVNIFNDLKFNYAFKKIICGDETDCNYMELVQIRDFISSRLAKFDEDKFFRQNAKIIENNLRLLSPYSYEIKIFDNKVNNLYNNESSNLQCIITIFSNVLKKYEKCIYNNTIAKFTISPEISVKNLNITCIFDLKNEYKQKIYTDASDKLQSKIMNDLDSFLAGNNISKKLDTIETKDKHNLNFCVEIYNKEYELESFLNPHELYYKYNSDKEKEGIAIKRKIEELNKSEFQCNYFTSNPRIKFRYLFTQSNNINTIYVKIFVENDKIWVKK